MKQARDVATCLRCRSAKRKCDQSKPSCSRCDQARTTCIYEDDQSDSSNSPQSLHSSIGDTATTVSTPTDTSQYRVKKKRNRACLTCTRCHRLKVKCDKKQPCGRCASSGFMDYCKYTHVVKPAPQRSSGSLVLTDEDPEFIVASWFLRKRSCGYHRALLDGMEALSGRTQTPFTRAVDETATGDCASDFVLAGNYPIGSAEAVPYMSLEKVQELLQEHHTDLPLFIDMYFHLYHRSLPVFEESTFREQVSAYHQQPLLVDAGWLAQYLIILGLGAYACGRGQTTSVKFMYASEACLSKTAYMFRPTITNISTLCLMVVAKQAAHATCWVIDVCWSVMGVVVHLSMMMVLHQEWMTGYSDEIFFKERILRRRLWTTVVFLYFQMAFLTGQQCLLPEETWQPALQDEPATLEACWDTLLPSMFPTISQLQTRITSTTSPITYPEVLHYDTLIRGYMQRILACPGHPILYLTLDIFFRRILCNLHTQHAVAPNAAVAYPTSYWSSLECSLAQMVHHRDISDGPEDMSLLSRPHMMGFFTAAFITCFQLLASPEGLAETAEVGGKTPARQTIMDTLTACLEIFSREEGQSLCFRTGFRQLKAIMGRFPQTE